MSHKQPVLSVHMSGPVLASLLYELGGSDHDLCGLLFGTVKQRVVTTLGDSTEVSHQEVSISVDSFRTLPLYDAHGAISTAAVLHAVSENSLDVIGWLKARRSATLQPSMKERIIHDKLRSFIAGTSFASSAQPPFIMCLLSAAPSRNKAIHSFDYRFLHRAQYAVSGHPSSSPSFVAPPFASLAVTTPNLDALSHDYRPILQPFSDPSAPDGTARQRSSPQLLLPGVPAPEPRTAASKVSEEVLSRLQASIGRSFAPNSYETTNAQAMETVCMSMIGRIHDLCKEICESEREIYLLEDQLADFQQSDASAELLRPPPHQQQLAPASPLLFGSDEPVLIPAEEDTVKTELHSNPSTANQLLLETKDYNPTHFL